MPPNRCLWTLFALTLLPACKGGGVDVLPGKWTCKSNDSASGESIEFTGNKMVRTYPNATMPATFEVVESTAERIVIAPTLDLDGTPVKGDNQVITLSADKRTMSIRNAINDSGADCTRD